MTQVGILFKKYNVKMYKCNVSLKRCPVFTVSKIACKLKGDVIIRKAMTSRLPPEKPMKRLCSLRAFHSREINVNVFARFSAR